MVLKGLWSKLTGKKPDDDEEDDKSLGDDLGSYVPPVTTPEEQEAMQREVWRDSIERWMMRLPVEARPVKLAENYQRVAFKLVALWDRPAELGPYLEDLIIDKRGGRAGFPAAVSAELLRLSEFHHRRLGSVYEPELPAPSARDFLEGK